MIDVSESITAAGEVSPRPARDSVLLSVGPLLEREVDLDQLLMQLLSRIVAAVGADRGTLYLLDADAGELFSRVAHHLPELKQIRLRLGQGLAGVVAQSGVGVNLADVSGDRRFFRDIDRQTGYRTRSVMAEPLRDAAGATLGVVQVLNARAGSFSADDVARLRRLAAEAALAIESTSLYSALRPRRASGLPIGYRYNHIVGESPAMQRVYALTHKAAATTATLLLRGETGTGKERLARAVHFNSPRADKPFVKLDCAAVPPTLMENELFGHERGAFTGADARAVGKCEAASGGTLFIDEIGELPLGLQPKLLRFLQDREFERIGGTRPLRSDARVIAATHRDLEAMVGRGLFREDLYYRIKVVQIVLPALRERGGDDLERLVAHFLDLYGRRHDKPARLNAAARARLLAHAWPGNIRELEHCIESAVVLADPDGDIRPEHLAIAGGVGPRGGGAAFVPRTLAAVEREHIAATLAATGGNKSRAAELLGIGRNTLLRKLRER